MKISLDYRNPTPSHCDVAIFVNGALAGTIRLRQEELDVFQSVISHGLHMLNDQFVATGSPGEWRTRGWPLGDESR